MSNFRLLITIVIVGLSLPAFAHWDKETGRWDHESEKYVQQPPLIVNREIIDTNQDGLISYNELEMFVDVIFEKLDENEDLLLQPHEFPLHGRCGKRFCLHKW